MNDAEVQVAVQTLAKVFEGKSRDEQKTLLAALERSGAAVYRALAADESDPAVREGLLLSAAREEENAAFLEGGV